MWLTARSAANPLPQALGPDAIVIVVSFFRVPFGAGLPALSGTWHRQVHEEMPRRRTAQASAYATDPADSRGRRQWL